MNIRINKLTIVAVMFALSFTSCVDSQEIKDRASKKAALIKNYVAAVAPTGLGVAHKSSNVEFQKAIEDKVGVLVDIRTPDEYAEGHIPGAVNVNFKKRTFKSYMSKFNKDEPILIYCRSGNRSGKGEKVMRALGFKEIYDLKSGYKGWKAASLPISTEDNEANIALQVELKANPPAVKPLESLGETIDVDVAEFKKLIESGEVTLVDVRKPDEYSTGFIQGAVNVDWKDRHFAETVVKEISNDKPVAIYCRSGNRSLRAETAMQFLGFTKVYNLNTGFKGWKAAGEPVATFEVKGDIRHLDVDNFNNAILGGVGVLVDVRTPAEHADYHIPGAICIDIKNSDFESQATKQLDKKTPVVIYCRSGVRSGKAMKKLEGMGFKVYNLDNGILEWKKFSMPLEGKNVAAHDSGEEGC